MAFLPGVVLSDFGGNSTSSTWCVQFRTF